MKNNESFIGISILNYNSSDALLVTLDSLAHMKTNVRFVCSVLDNDSTDCKKAHEIFSKFQKNRPERAGEFIASSKNLGFSGGNNVLIKKFLENPLITHILLANSDLSFTDNSLDRMLELGVDAVGPVTGKAGNTQTIETGLDLKMSTKSLPQINFFAQKRFDTFGNSYTEVPMLVFFCVLLSRDLIENVGLLDEQFFPGSYEDDDYCMRMIESGYKLYCARGVFIYHWGSASFSKLPTLHRTQVGEENRSRLEEKWGKPWVPRTADPLISYKQDIDFLLKKTNNTYQIPELHLGFDKTVALITEQDAAIRFYQGKLNELRDILSSSNPHLDSADDVYMMTPIRRGIPQVPGRVLMKQLTSKIVRRLLGTLRVNPNRAITLLDWNDFDELSFMEACAQLIERIAFKITKPLHAKAEKKENRTENINVNVPSNDFNVEPSEDIQSLIQHLLYVDKPSAAFLAPYPNDEFLRDGYYKRIKNIDDLFSLDYFRIYISQYDIPIPNPRVIYHLEQSVEIQYNFHNKNHIRQIAKVINKCSFLYTHSIIRINTLLLGQIIIPKILDFHGSVPEEARLYNDFAGEKNCEKLEQYATTTFDMFIFVTDAMRFHIEKKYKKSLAHFILLPTYDEYVLNSFVQEQIFSKETSEYLIVYSGGTQKWQRIDLILKAIKKRSDLKYLILTPDTSIIQSECEKKKIKKNVQIKSVAPEDISEEYKKCHYGFILRDDIVVNHVACPTKLMEYMAYGIIPIMHTPNIGDFVSLGMQYVAYADFITGKLPDEQQRAAMMNHNFQVAHKFAEIYLKGKESLLSHAKSYLDKTFLSPQNSSKKESIGLVVGSFDKGGLEQAVFNLYEGYSASGHDTYILCQSNYIGHFADKLASQDDIFIFENNSKRFFDFCRKKNIRWLHYHYSTFMIEEARDLGLRTIYSIQNVYTWLSDKEINARSKLINSADAVVAGSTFSKNYYCSRTDTSYEKVSVIPIGVNTADLDSTSMNPELTREKLNIKPKEITLGFIASFHQVKHQMNMIGAMEKIIQKNPNIKLLFVANIGHSDYYRAVRKAWDASTARNNILFVPFIDHLQLGEFLRQTIDIFILPSIQEGCSNAVIDALYVGKPMLLTDVGNATDLAHLESVTVVSRPYEDLLSFRQSDIDKLCMKKYCINTSEIADKILWISENLESQNEAAKKAAEQYRNQCDKQYMIDQYLDIIDS